jgi:hypothetical protein
VVAQLEARDGFPGHGFSISLQIHEGSASAILRDSICLRTISNDY